MHINSALNEGLAGMQQSQKKMQQAAEDIVKAGMPTDHSVHTGNARSVAITNNGTAVEGLRPSQAVEATSEPEAQPALSLHYSPGGDIVDPLIEQKRQQLLFDASANIVKAANEALGTLIDDLS